MPTTELDAPTSECALPSPVKPSRSGVVQFCQPLPHTSNSRLLSVSHDVSQDDLFHPNDKVVHITVKLPRRRNRKAHKDLESERSEESETMKDLIKMVDCGEVPLPRSRVSLEDLDFSGATTSSPETSEDDEDPMSVFNALMREKCEKSGSRGNGAWRGKVRGDGEEEELIWDER